MSEAINFGKFQDLLSNGDLALPIKRTEIEKYLTSYNTFKIKDNIYILPNESVHRMIKLLIEGRDELLLNVKKVSKL